MYRWREHTAELELAVEAASEQEVFGDAADAFGRLIEVEDGGDPARHEVELEAPDLGALLVDWLEELIFLADTASFVPDRVATLELRDYRLKAVVEGRRTTFDPLVKAATYHKLEFRNDQGRWYARVVLDV